MSDIQGDNQDLQAGLARALARAGMPEPEGLERLTGGATMESWRFDASGEPYVLRRAPSLEFMQDRPFGHATEAAIITAAHAAGVTAPEVAFVLEADDRIGSGFVMRALPGTPDPRAILAMERPEQLLAETARDLAKIHALPPDILPPDVPVMDYAEGVAGLREQFDEAGGNRPIIALGLLWLEDNIPSPVTPVLNHGDYRLGNILAEDGHLTGVLDWELAHFGDPHEDIAFGCMAVWRFARYDRPALGLGTLDEYFAAYEAAGGISVDRDRFRYWLIYRTVWWALGCLRMADIWRRGEDRMLERVVISRRTSEQELDLLMLLEEDAPEEERARLADVQFDDDWSTYGEANLAEMLEAVSEWLGTVKHRMEGHDRFQLAVARNALGMAMREEAVLPGHFDSASITHNILTRRSTLASPGLLKSLRHGALEKLYVDVPKYPALAVARKKWTGDE